jgi:prepilin-type N-terminal cleavage/methylation domain-containing protein
MRQNKEVIAQTPVAGDFCVTSVLESSHAGFLVNPLMAEEEEVVSKGSLSCQRGFSLIELSIVLVIIGSLLGITLGVMTRKSDADRIRITQERLNVIQHALSVYLIEQRAIPCPADATLAISHTNFGVESTSGASCNENRSDVGLTAKSTGSVPTRTLQIPDYYAFDGWGRRITYVMVESCHNATNTGASPGFSNDTSCGNNSGGVAATALILRDNSGTVINNQIIALLISHGTNGHGAYPVHGGAVRLNFYQGASAPLSETQNAEMTIAGATSVNSGIYIQPSLSKAVDDIVRYLNKDQLIRLSKGLKGVVTNGVTDRDTRSPLCNIVNADSAIGAIPDLAAASGICGSSPNNTDCAVDLNDLSSQIRDFCF